MKKFSVREIRPNGESRKRALYIIIQLYAGKMSLCEKRERNLKKVVDMCSMVWYYNQAVARDSEPLKS